MFSIRVGYAVFRISRVTDPEWTTILGEGSSFVGPKSTAGVGSVSGTKSWFWISFCRNEKRPPLRRSYLVKVIWWGGVSHISFQTTRA